MISNYSFLVGLVMTITCPIQTAPLPIPHVMVKIIQMLQIDELILNKKCEWKVNMDLELDRPPGWGS
jgi:hypothetical protein